MEATFGSGSHFGFSVSFSSCLPEFNPPVKLSSVFTESISSPNSVPFGAKMLPAPFSLFLSIVDSKERLSDELLSVTFGFSVSPEEVEISKESKEKKNVSIK